MSHTSFKLLKIPNHSPFQTNIFHFDGFLFFDVHLLTLFILSVMTMASIAPVSATTITIFLYQYYTVLLSYELYNILRNLDNHQFLMFFSPLHEFRLLLWFHLPSELHHSILYILSMVVLRELWEHLLMIIYNATILHFALFFFPSLLNNFSFLLLLANSSPAHPLFIIQKQLSYTSLTFNIYIY